MIRRDYLLRQIEEFVAVIAKMAGLTKAGQWEEASSTANSQFKALAGADVTELLRMSDTELIARRRRYRLRDSRQNFHGCQVV
jgi:hypothetical protein